MKGFNFRLQRVLDLRITIEDQIKNQLGVIRNEVKKEEDTLERFLSEQRQRLDQVEGKATGEVSPWDMTLEVQYLQNLRNRIQLQHHKIQDLKVAEEKKREELLKASQDRKILEKLKERKFEEFQKTVESKEQALTDEVAGRLGLTWRLGLT